MRIYVQGDGLTSIRRRISCDPTRSLDVTEAIFQTVSAACRKRAYTAGAALSPGLAR